MLDPFCGTATMSLARGSGRVWRSRVKVVGKNSALKHGRNSIGVELDIAYGKLTASRLMNESTLFGSAKLQIELKPHMAVEPVAVLQEKSPAYKTRARKKTFRRRS